MLLCAIENVAAGKEFLDPALKEQMIMEMIETKRNQQQAVLALTKREVEILKLIAAELTSPEIGQQLFKPAYCP